MGTKDLFRFYRGELTNGHYLKHLLTFINKHAKDLTQDLAYRTKMPWELAVNDETYDDTIGQFPGAAVYPQTRGSIWLPPSMAYKGQPASERVLVDINGQDFYIPSYDPALHPDINDFATSHERAVLVEHDAPIIGYIPAGAAPFDDDGNIIMEQILASPPEDKAWVPFYGEKYLHFEYQYHLPAYHAKDEDLFGIGKTGGLFPGYISVPTNLGSAWLAPRQEAEDGSLITERQMADIEFETTRFVDYDGSGDINDQAASMLRTTLVEPGAVPVGYIATGQDADIFDLQGSVKSEYIKSQPPEGLAWVPYYGAKYLHLEYEFFLTQALDKATYKELFEHMQVLRRNGPTLTEFLALSDFLVKDIVDGIDITQYNHYYYVKHTYHAGLSDAKRAVRYRTWQYIVNMKFKNFVLYDRQDNVD